MNKQKEIKKLLKLREHFKMQGRKDDVWLVEDYLKDLGWKKPRKKRTRTPRIKHPSYKAVMGSRRLDEF